MFVLIFGIGAIYLSDVITAGATISKEDVDVVNAIDTGLDKTSGVKLDLIQNGLTHKVLEIDFGEVRKLERKC